MNLVKIKTDNHNLTFLNGNSNRQRKWRNDLNEFNFEISHIPGDKNNAADYLSRNFYIAEIPNLKLDEIVAQVSSVEGQIIWKDIKGLPLPFDSKNRLVIPDSMINSFLVQIHEILGHPGRCKTKKTLKEYFIFSEFNNRIDKFCKGCLLCAKNKSYFQPINEIKVLFLLQNLELSLI